MNPSWIIRTARLVLTPVGGADLPDLRAIKADPRVFAIMLGGVRTSVETAEELADDVVAWGANGFGIWAIRELVRDDPDLQCRRTSFVGITGLERRPDGRGVALRFALWPRRRDTAWRAKRLAPRCASVTSRPACRVSSRWRARTISPRAWCWAASA